VVGAIDQVIMSTAKKIQLLLAAAAWAVNAALATNAFAAPPADVQITNAWARPTVPGQAVGAAYFDVRSAQGATVVEVRSDVADAVQVHEMSRDGDIMRMRELKTLALPAGQTVHLSPGGIHLMLLELKHPLRVGETVPLRVTLEDARGRKQTLQVSAPISANPPVKAR
jgi:periplasmic copper chaperone A